MSNSQWTLDVTVLVIDMKQVEKKDGEFCCCDAMGMDMDCQESPSEVGTCEVGKCDPLLNVTVAPCTESTSSGPCSVSTVKVKDAETFSDYGYFFQFTTTAQAKNVRYTYSSTTLCSLVTYVT